MCIVLIVGDRMDWLDFKEFMLDSIKFIIVFIILLVLMVYVVSITQVVGNSMYPNLKNQDVLLLNKAKYRFFDVERGDLISFTYDDTKYLIKRVIGLPGDTIQIKDNQVYINGEKYQEDYIENKETEDFDISELGYEKVPRGMYFVLGDNRSNSMDSREIGFVSKDQIIGEVALRFWPLNKIKFY